MDPLDDSEPKRTPKQDRGKEEMNVERGARAHLWTKQREGRRRGGGRSEGVEFPSSVQLGALSISFFSVTVVELSAYPNSPYLPMPAPIHGLNELSRFSFYIN
ncbi:hypothetical protein CRG98_037849 [Punica granatum]|uniref:Uncharacterized protein n=1 Tax=Punica granatum TaxID=22663 RepID=A0A2I0ICP8_PUNGR|nr:hypothetical protein CRG98_037849 [Punica granatum]